MNDLPATARAPAREEGGVHRAILESTDQGYCTIEVAFDKNQKPVDYRFLEVSPAFERQTGIENGAGRWMREIAPDQDQFWFDVYGRVALTGKAERFEDFSTPLNRWYSVNAFKIERHARVAVLFDDITDRKRAEAALQASEQSQSFLLNLSDALHPLTTPAEIADLAADRLGEQYGLSRVLFATLRGSRMIVEHDFTQGVDSLVGEHDLTAFGPKLLGAYHDGAVITVRDVGTDPRFNERARSGLQDRQVGAYVDVILFEEDQSVSLLAAQSATPRDWTAAEESVFRDVARRVKAALERTRAETAVRASEERFRGFVTASADVVYRMSPDWTQLCQLDGQGFIDDSPEPSENWMDDYILPEDRDLVQGAIDHAVRTKSQMDLEHRVIRADGTPGWTKSRAIPMLDEHGEIMEWLGTASDITERVKAAQSFTRLFEASPAPFLVLAPDPPCFTITEVNDAYLAATMRTREELVGRALFAAFPDNPNEPNPTGVKKLRASLEQVLVSRMPDELPGLKYDIPRPDGTYEERWWSPVNSPILDEKGEVEAIIHNANDVTNEHRSERHQRLLLAELQHRVRNILTVVRSIARRTADNCEDVDDYVRHLDGRLASLARVQTILTRDPGRGVDLHEMVLEELDNQGALPAHFQIEGPDVKLAPKAAEVLTLAVHELATNSTKYGVLSGSTGAIRISWEIDDHAGQPWLNWTWREPVGTTSKAPARTGFGSDLIKNRVPYELRGTGEFRIGDDEVKARIRFPVTKEAAYV